MIALTSTFLNKGVLIGKVNPQPNGQVTLEYPDGTVISCQPDGTLQSRPNGTAGAYELCNINGNLVVYNPVGVPYFFGAA
jgi:hypothetical protein